VPESGYVFDGFAGSGTILIAAQRFGHPWMGVERNPDYRQLALKRLAVNIADQVEHHHAFSFR
jgi:site-specific DNA-methyltransferase (adenine-specific)